jgi:peptidoglycan/LPS O-acetylase OafA/YrhL
VKLFLIWGGWGVSVFIVLSGFLMTYSYNDRVAQLDVSLKGCFRFAISKIKKLYPLHIIMMLIEIPIDVVQIYLGRTDLTIQQLIAESILHILLLQTWIPIQRIYFGLNGVAWYLSVSMFLYFMFPFILKKIRKLTVSRILIYAAILYGILFTVIAIDELLFADNGDALTYFNYVWPLLRLCDFAIGCNFGMIFLQRRDRLRTGSANFLEIATLLLTILTVWFSNIDHFCLLGKIVHHSTFIYVPTSVALVYLFAENKGILTKTLTNKLFVYIGDISPYGYLIHQKVIAYLIIIFTYVVGKPLNLYIRAFMTVVITLAAIYIYKWFENEFIKKLGTRLG